MELGGKGKNINDDIGEFVKNGTANPEIQQALDAVRIVGNNAVHPGQMDLIDDAETAVRILVLINLIVARAITEPRELAEFYEALPDDALDAVEKRDRPQEPGTTD